VNKRRDKLLLTGGLLTGFGVGLCVGMDLFLIATMQMLHHMFIIGVRWSSPGLWVLLAVPLVLVVVGAVTLRRARGLRDG